MKIIKRRRMKIEQEQFPLRKELESCVTAHNKHLKSTVRFMPLVILLNNCHPLYRNSYAFKLHKLGKLTDEELLQYGKGNKNYEERL